MTKQLIRTTKLKYAANLVCNNTNPSEMWRKLKELGLGKQNEIARPVANLDELNNYFIQAGSHQSTTDTELERPPPFIETNKNLSTDKFFFRNVTIAVIISQIRKLKSDTRGPDNITLKMIKIIEDVIAGPICFIINHSFRSGIFPMKWKRAMVCPIRKTNTPKEASDYRPISILSVFSKIKEEIN